MKSMRFYMAGLFAVLLAFACTDEDVVKTSDTFRITGGIGADTRIAFVEEDNVTHTQWVANDGIGLYTDAQSNLSYKALTSGSTTEFTPTGTDKLVQEDGKTVYAYYPYVSATNGNAVRLPYTFLIQDNSVPAFLYSTGTIAGNELNFSFKHLYAYLKVTITAQEFRDMYPGDGYTYENCGIYLTSTEPLSTDNNSYYDIATDSIWQLSDDIYRLIYYCKDMNVTGDGSYTYMIPVLPQSAQAEVDVCLYYFQENSSSIIGYRVFISKDLPDGGFQAGHVYTLNTSADVLPDESQVAALRAFYQSTGGDAWNDNSNWLSDRPLEDWYGVNNYAPNYSYVYSLQLGSNNLTGQLPEELAVLMDKANYIYLNGNYLTGEIPQAVKEHANWNQLGWNIILQDVRHDGGLNLENSNLYITDATLTDLLDGSQSSLHTLLAQNKLTQVILADDSSSELIRIFGVDRVNAHLDFQSKGLGTLIFTTAEVGTDPTELRTFIQGRYAGVEGVHWLYGAPENSTASCCSYLYDANGQLMHVAQYQLGYDNTDIAEAEYEFLRAYLGEPDTSHDPFSLSYYTSSDYSQDGEVFTLQNATEGQGINLVFMGEGFTDQDMAVGGAYEQAMGEAASKLFELEPYNSFRQRFNVYGVKVVSPNAEFTDDAVRRINEDDAIAFEYAQKAVGEDEGRMMVAVVYNTDDYAGRSFCRTYFADGSFVAYIMVDATENVIIHEVGGHGVAKLADEYIEQGNETVTLPQDQIEFLDRIASWDWGWYANVDYQGTSSTVKWAHLLSDSRYATEDLGIYEGGFCYGLGAYRPSDDSMMCYNIGWFNAPSREAIYKAIMTLSEGSGWTYDYEEFVSYDAINRGSATRSLLRPLSVAERRQVVERHRPPQWVPGTWRDALSAGKP